MEEPERLEDRSKQKLYTLWDIISRMDIIMILAQNALVIFVVSQADLLVNMVAVDNFRWSLFRLSIVTIMGVLSSITFMVVIQKRFKCGINTYFFLPCCLISIWLLLILLVLATNFMIADINQQMLIIFFALLLDIIPSYSSPGWSLVLLYFVVPAHSRSFVSGIRYAAEKVGNIIGYSIAAFAYSHSAVLYFPLVGCCFILTVTLLVRRTTFFAKYNLNECR